MKIYKSKFGWSTTAHSKTMTGEEIKNYVDVGFKKGYEPNVEELEGNLIFKDKDGNERVCFLTSYMKHDGSKCLKLMIMGGDEIKKDDPSKMFGGQIKIETEELPFY